MLSGIQYFLSFSAKPSKLKIGFFFLFCRRFLLAIAFIQFLVDLIIYLFPDFNSCTIFFIFF